MQSTGLKIVLVEPEIPPNTGNVARLCAANDWELHLIQPMGFTLDDKKLKRAGLDYWNEIKITLHANFQTFLEEHPVSQMHFFSTKAKRTLFEASFLPNAYLVFGKESSGLPEKFIWQYQDQSVRIPQQNSKIRSLNLSTAVGIASYEAYRQILISHS